MSSVNPFQILNSEDSQNKNKTTKHTSKGAATKDKHQSRNGRTSRGAKSGTGNYSWYGKNPNNDSSFKRKDFGRRNRGFEFDEFDDPNEFPLEDGEQPEPEKDTKTLDDYLKEKQAAIKVAEGIKEIDNQGFAGVVEFKKTAVVGGVFGSLQSKKKKGKKNKQKHRQELVLEDNSNLAATLESVARSNRPQRKFNNNNKRFGKKPFKKNFNKKKDFNKKPYNKPKPQQDGDNQVDNNQGGEWENTKKKVVKKPFNGEKKPFNKNKGGKKPYNKNKPQGAKRFNKKPKVRTDSALEFPVVGQGKKA